jgi:class 3 adenylate cyclase
MFNLGALDVVISLVVVLIILSLVVQSIQQLVKKVWKLKSRVLLRSLEDLFGKLVKADVGAGNSAAPEAAPTSTARSNSLWARLTRAFGRVHSADAMVTELVEELKLLGRRSLFNRPMLDSIAKDDVVKVLTRLGATKIYQESFQKIRTALDEVIATFEAARTVALQGGASARLASLQQSLTPLASDLEGLAQGSGVLPTTVLTDLLNLRRLRMQDAFNLLAEVQDRVQKDLAAAAGQDTEGLKNVDAALRTAADKLKLLGDRIEDAVAPLSARLCAVELWYDTVMQGFEERYTRHMKTVTVGVAILTVIALNANFFTLYGRIVSDPKLRGNLATAGQTILDQRQKTEPAATETPVPAAAETPAATETPATSDAVTSDAAAQDTSMQDVQQAGQQVRRQVEDYESLGLSRLHWSDIKRYWSLNSPWGTEKDRMGWGLWFGSGLNTLFGWLITILLLSTGAPFWEDVLESLFGLKSLMRKKTATRNVEDGEGGQPKP